MCYTILLFLRYTTLFLIYDTILYYVILHYSTLYYKILYYGKNNLSNASAGV